MVRRWRIGLLGLAVSVLAVIIMIGQVNGDLLIEALRTARYSYLLPTVLLLIAALFPRAQRWRVLLGGALPFGRAFSIMNVAYLVNGILPLRIGEVARAFLATRADPPVPVLKSASTIIVERLLDLLAVLVLMGAALASSPLPDEYRAAAAFFTPAVILGFGLLIILASQRRLAHRLLAIVVSGLPPLRKLPLANYLDHFLDGLQPLTQPRVLLLAVFWTVISWGFSVLAGYIVMPTFFDAGNWAGTCLYIAAAAFAIAVPAVPGNIGTYEWSIMLALSALGYGEPVDARLVSFAVIVHWTNLVVHALTGVVGLVQEGISLDQLSRGVQQMTQESQG